MTDSGALPVRCVSVAAHLSSLHDFTVCLGLQVSSVFEEGIGLGYFFVTHCIVGMFGIARIEVNHSID